MNSSIQLSAENTSVVLLAAGFGKRMAPLTEHTPKPLLKVGQRSLIEHHLHRLAQLGFKHVVINIAHLGQRIIDTLGDGFNYGLSIQYSDEISSGPLETAGGIVNALPLIASDPFLVINADIWIDFDFTELLNPLQNDGRLLMVPNPLHNPLGDFALKEDGCLSVSGQHKLTFSGVALYAKAMFDQLPEGKAALGPIFKSLIAQDRLEGLEFAGRWEDVGTPERLAQLDNELNEQASD